MEIRKVQRTGDMHYVYMPTNWCKKHQITSKSQVNLKESPSGALIISPTETKAILKDLNINLDSAKFSAAEKFRQILEVYDIESAYSLSLESYRDMVDINSDGSEVEVEMLRIGRVALMYQTKDKSQTGAWNKTTGSWETLGSEYRRAVNQGIRIAKKLSPQDVMEMPITAPETAQ